MAKEDPITDKQSGMIAYLMRTRDASNLPEAQEKFLRTQSNWARMNRQQASNAIAALQLCDELPTTANKMAGDEAHSPGADSLRPAVGVSIPEGRYWIGYPEDRFIKVDKPTEGRWSGYTFVHVQASDNFFPVRDRAKREEILQEIAKDPLESMRQYGLKLGVCGRCGLTLTNEVSRSIGFGPICCEALGIEYGIEGKEFNDDEIANLLGEE
jgi:hypothetical protein